MSCQAIPPVEIIIIEDNQSDVELLTRVFRKHNLANDVTVLKDGVEALDYLLGGNNNTCNVNKPRLIVLDIKLPKIDGIEVLSRIKADDRTRSIPIMVLTSSKEDRDLKAAEEAGVNCYVTKPIDFKGFASVASELDMCLLLVSKKTGGFDYGTE
ncbi:MAG: response regulator [Armatimonadetes bacterium]|nr:response regulator [Armatimonadota bacterium]